MATDNINTNQNYFQPGQGGNPSGTVAPVNTAQPSPATTQVATPSQTASGINPSDPSLVNALDATGQKSDFASRTALAGQYGIQNYTGNADQNTQLLQKYTAGLNTAQRSGKTAPTSAGEASAAVQTNLPQTTADTQAQQAASDQAKAITQQLQNDPGFQQLQKDQQDYLSSQNQQQTLQQQYTDLTNQAGIPAINTQLINMKSIMDGTEQDIRNEITKSGGFATNSQVMALTAARNKTMIQNYNNLLQTRDDAVNQINTTMGFAKEDQANAQSVAKEKMDYDQQVIQYEQKMQQNAQDAYQNIIKTPGYGYSALYQSTGGDPHTISLVEGTLGLPPGSLAQLSQIPDSSKTQVVKLDNGNTVLINSQTGQTIKNLGGQFASGATDINSLPPDSSSQSILNQTGLSIQAFNYLTQGTGALTRLSAGERTKIMGEAQSWANKNGIDLSTFQSQFKAQNDVVQKNIERAANTKVFGGEVSGTVSQFIQDIGNDISNLKPAAVTDLFVKGQTNDKTAQKYAFDLQTMQNDLAGYYAASRGATAPDKSDLDAASKVITQGLSSKGAQAFKESMDTNLKKVSGVVDEAVTSAQGSIWKLFGVNKPSTENSAPSSLPQDVQSKISSNLTFSPDGKTVYIPRSVWSTLGGQMDAVLKEAQNEGFTLLVK